MEGHAINDMKLRKQIDIQRKTSVNRTQLRVLARQRLKQTKAFAQIPLFLCFFYSQRCSNQNQPMQRF